MDGLTVGGMFLNVIVEFGKMQDDEFTGLTPAASDKKLNPADH